jgi:hypothetical protein
VDGRGRESADQKPRVRAQRHHTTHIRRREVERMGGGTAKGREVGGRAGGEVEGVGTNPRIGSRESAPKGVIRRIYDEGKPKE